MMRKWTLGGLAALVALWAAPAFAVTIELSVGEVTEGTVNVDVILRSEGDGVGGMQNDILYDTNVVTLERTSSCSINDAIGDRLENCEEDPEFITEPCKTLSRNRVTCGDSPDAPGCEGQAANIGRFRGIVAATAVPNNNEIPDGAVLYTCEFTVVDAGSFPTTLGNTNVVASDPFGTRLDATGTEGVIGGGVDPTATPTTGVDPTPTPTSPPAGCTEDVCIDVGSAAPVEGKAFIDIVVTGENVGGAQNDILFDSSIINLERTSRCSINDAIGDRLENCEEDPEFITEPCKTLSRNLVNCGDSPDAPGCEGQPANISRFRGIIAATAVPNNIAIPSGSVLYTCEFDVLDATGLTTVLTNTNIVASDPFGARLNAGGINGAVLGEGQPPTPTPTVDVPDPTATPTVDLPDPTATPTNTSVPTNTATVAPTATATATRVATTAPNTAVVAEPAPAAATEIVVAGAENFPNEGFIRIDFGPASQTVGYRKASSPRGAAGLTTLILNAPLQQSVTAGTTIQLVDVVGEDDDDGCHIAATGATNSRGWLVLLPALGLLALRRRRRA